jgi:hypothetical protein
MKPLQDGRSVSLRALTPAAEAYRSVRFCTYGTELEIFSRGGQFYDEYLMTLALNSDNDRNA